MKRIILAAALSSFLMPAHAANWVLVGKLDFGASLFMDAESVKRSEHFVVAWSRINYDLPQVRGPSFDQYIFNELKTYDAFDCQNRMSGNISGAYYNGNGKVVKNIPYTKPSMAPVIPDSMGEIMLKAACGE